MFHHDSFSSRPRTKVSTQTARTGSRSQYGKLLEDIDKVTISHLALQKTKGALNWVKSTLFSIRLRKDSSKFGVVAMASDQIKMHLLKLCTASIRRLDAIRTIVAQRDRELFALPVSHTVSQQLVDLPCDGALQGTPM